MRPRERYLERGPEAVADLELLALIINTGDGKRSALDIGGQLLESFGDLHTLAGAPLQALMSQPGIGPARAVQIHAALHAGRRAIQGKPRDATVTGPEAAWQLLRPRLQGLDVEELHAIFLGRRCEVIGVERISRGSAGFTIVDPRQIYRRALVAGAASLILGHNHPSGDPTPSQEDLQVTQRLRDAGAALALPLADHLVLGHDRFVSFRERGLLLGGGEYGGPPTMSEPFVRPAARRRRPEP